MVSASQTSVGDLELGRWACGVGSLEIPHPSCCMHPFYHLHPQAHGSTCTGHLQILTFRHLCSSVLHVHLLGSPRCSCTQPWFPCTGTLLSHPASPGSGCRLYVFTCPLPPWAPCAVLGAEGAWPASPRSLLCVCARAPWRRTFGKCLVK